MERDLSKLNDAQFDRLLDAVFSQDSIHPEGPGYSNVVSLPVKPKSFNLTDLGNAERLVHYFGQDMRFCHTWNKWLIYDGKRWVVDNCGAVERLAQATVRRMYGECQHIENVKTRQELASYALRSESSKTLKSMVDLAKVQEGIPSNPNDLDANPWLLNCENGTIDLTSGELKPHNRKDLISKLVPVNYDPQAKAPLWEAFLNRIMDRNQDLIQFLQRAIGYSLTGSTREDALFVLHGNGANGKTTFLETIAAMMGDGYSQQAPTSMLMAKKYEGVPTDIARLKGARFVSVAESQEGQKLDEGLIKQLTGGDRVTARFMRADFFEFTPECKIFLATNHKPEIKGTDEGIWRRIRLIPFNVSIPEPERDPDLANKLQAELPGILAWAVEGCLIWQKVGLNPPPEVCAATQEYRAEQDVLGAFVAERCKVGAGLTVTNPTLRKAFDEYCEETGAETISQTAFGRKLKAMGFKQDRTAGIRYWEGIELKNEQ